MSISILIYYLNIFVWLLPPIRQYKGKYFYYFFLLAITDPVAYFLLTFTGISLDRTYLLAMYGCIIALMGFRRTILLQYLTGLIFLLGISYIGIVSLRLIIMAEVLAVLYIILKRIISYYTVNQEFYFFHIMLMLYEISVLSKFLYLLLIGRAGYIYFFITTAFEIIIAIYFFMIRGKETDEFNKESRKGVE